MKKLTIEEMQNRINMNNPYNSIILNDNVHHTEVLCGKCGQKYKTTFHTILKSKFAVCLECSKKLKGTKLAKLEDIKKEIDFYGFTQLLTEYNGCHKLFPVEDKYGYKGTLSLVSMRRGANISYFAKYNIYALDNLRKYCKDNGINCIIPEQVYNGWDSPLKIICSCGELYTTTLTHFLNDNKHQCLSCSGSKSSNEKIIEEWLNKNNVKFLQQHKFKNCFYKKLLPFDFYLPDYNTCIEVDGEGHEKPTRFNGINKDRANILFEETKTRDNIKDKYCKDNNINLIRINHYEIKNKGYINILSSIIH